MLPIAGYHLESDVCAMCIVHGIWSLEHHTVLHGAQNLTEYSILMKPFWFDSVDSNERDHVRSNSVYNPE